MARIRTIKPEFFKNEELAELPCTARLFFIGLWTQADREGKLLDRPKRLKAELFPYDNINIEDLLSRLQSAGFIERYEVGEMKLIQISKFLKHQCPNVRELKSDLPDKISASTIPVQCQHDTGTLGREGKGREREDGKKLISELKITDCRLPPDDIGYQVIEASIRLYNGFVAEFPTNRDLPLTPTEEWIPPVRFLMEKKKYTYDQIKKVVEFALKDKFWKKVVLNTVALENNFEKIKVQYHG